MQFNGTTSITVTRLEYLVSQVRFQQQTGDWTKPSGRYFHFNPLEQDCDLNLDLPTSQSVRAIAFNIGLPPAINHADPARWGAGHPLNVLECNLHWGWATGYVFLAIEGTAKDTQHARKTFLYHIGNDPNLMTVELAVPPGLSLSQSEILFRLDKLWEGENVVTTDEGGGMTHSTVGDTLATRLARNIEKCFQLRERNR